MICRLFFCLSLTMTAVQCQDDLVVVPQPQAFIDCKQDRMPGWVRRSWMAVNAKRILAAEAAEAAEDPRCAVWTAAVANLSTRLPDSPPNYEGPAVPIERLWDSDIDLATFQAQYSSVPVVLLTHANESSDWRHRVAHLRSLRLDEKSSRPQVLNSGIPNGGLTLNEIPTLVRKTHAALLASADGAAVLRPKAHADDGMLASSP